MINKNIIDIADILFANPTKEVSVIVSEIVSKCHKTERTVWRWIKKAQDYNAERLNKQEQIKAGVLAKQTKDNIKKAVLSRENILEELRNDFVDSKRIVSGSVFKDIDPEGNVIGYRQAGFNDEINAKKLRVIIAQRLSELEGWDSAKKIDSSHANISVNVIIGDAPPLVENENDIDD